MEEYDQDSPIKLDYEKMIDNVNMNHPRMIKKNSDGNIVFKKLPLCTKVGNLISTALEKEPKYE